MDEWPSAKKRCSVGELFFFPVGRFEDSNKMGKIRVQREMDSLGVYGFVK